MCFLVGLIFFSRHIENLHFFFFNKMKAALSRASIFFPLLLIIFLFFLLGHVCSFSFLYLVFLFCPLFLFSFFRSRLFRSFPIFNFSFFFLDIFCLPNFKNCSKLTIVSIYNQKNIPSFLVINQMNNILFRLMIIHGQTPENVQSPKKRRTWTNYKHCKQYLTTILATASMVSKLQKFLGFLPKNNNWRNRNGMDKNLQSPKKRKISNNHKYSKQRSTTIPIASNMVSKLQKSLNLFPRNDN